MVLAFQQPTPEPRASELVWSGYWDLLLTSMFKAARAARGLGIYVDRDVVDATLTSDNKRRDFCLFLQVSLF